MKIKRLELLGVVEGRAHGVSHGGVSLQHRDVKLIGPPRAVGGGVVGWARVCCNEGALTWGGGGHGHLSIRQWIG